MSATPLTASADIEALWSPEGQVAALAAALVALSDALGLAESDQLDAQLSSPDFDFSPACAALDDGAAVEAFPALETGARYGGAAFLIAYGIKSLLSAFGPDHSLEPEGELSDALAKLNPVAARARNLDQS